MATNTATCGQLLGVGDKRCEKPTAFLFTWPGKDEAGICADHAPQLRAVANVIGLHLQLKPISTSKGD